MTIKKISSSYYVVNDMEASLRFYRDTLNLDVKFQDGDKWTQFDVNGQALAIATPAPQQVNPGEGATVVLEVDDLAQQRQTLIAAGVEASETVSMGDHGSFFTVRDPAGNLVQFFAR
ncbi:MAG: VOC family protein [Gammaproteobacteria bacterium]